MQVGKMKPAATIVAQFPAGVEVESIQYEGKLFMPVLSLGEFAPKVDEPAPVSEPETKKAEPSAKKTTSKKYTEDELMEMPVKELTKILTKMGIDPDEYEGKNTNKKLRNLILDNQDEEDADGDDNEETNDEEEEETPKTKKASKKEEDDDDDEANEGEEDPSVTQVTSILEDFDAGKKNKKKTIAAIVDVLGDVDSDKVASLVEEFTDDSDADMEEFAQRIVDTFTKKKGAKKPTKKSKEDEEEEEEEELVSVEDLKKGDRVSVYWDDDNQDWFDGTVASVKKGKVVIDYDDDTSEPIDPEVHTKIKRLAE